MFRAERGAFPVSWASHLAITDESGERFLYDQRSEVGPQVDRSVPGEGFDLAISGDVLPGVRDTVEPWRMRGMLTHHELEARGEAGPDGTPIGLRLSLEDPVAEPLLHGGNGWIDFGPAGSSYYHSRPRMAATGEIEVGGEVLEVEGSAWYDHQWGDFISVGGGWDWFAVNLDDGTDLTVSVIRDPPAARSRRTARSATLEATARCRREACPSRPWGRGRHRTPGSPGRPAGSSRCPRRTFR